MNSMNSNKLDLATVQTKFKVMALATLFCFSALGCVDLMQALNTASMAHGMVGIAFIAFSLCSCRRVLYAGTPQKTAPASQLWGALYYSSCIILIIGVALKRGWIQF